MTTEEILVKVTEVDSRSKSNCHRLDEVEKRQSDSEKMLNSISLIAQKQESIEGDMREIKADVKSLTGKSGKRFDGLVDKAILMLAAAIFTYVLAKIGLGG